MTQRTTVGAMNPGDVEDSIQGGICMNISSWLLICHRVRSLIINPEGLWQSKVSNGSDSCVYLQIKLFCISAGSFQLCKGHFHSFQFLLREWEQGAQGRSFFSQRRELCAHLDLVTSEGKYRSVCTGFFGREDRTGEDGLL